MKNKRYWNTKSPTQSDADRRGKIAIYYTESGYKPDWIAWSYNKIKKGHPWMKIADAQAYEKSNGENTVPKLYDTYPV